MVGILLEARRRPVTHDEAEQALGALGSEMGLYFGTESGLPGVHPQQAILITQPAWQMMVWSDGIECRALDDWGEGLLSRPAIASWVEGARRCPAGRPRGQRPTGSPAEIGRAHV